MKYRLYEQYYLHDFNDWNDDTMVIFIYLNICEIKLSKLEEIALKLKDIDNRLDYLNNELLPVLSGSTIYNVCYNKDKLVKNFVHEFAINIGEHYMNNEIKRLNINDDGSVNLYYQGKPRIAELSDSKIKSIVLEIDKRIMYAKQDDDSWSSTRRDIYKYRYRMFDKIVRKFIKNK